MLNRYDIVLYSINKDKNCFGEYIFQNHYDFSEGLSFCIDNGIIFDYEELFFVFCRFGNINCLKHLIEIRNFKPSDKDSEWNCLHTICFYEHEEELVGNVIKTITYLVNELKYDINFQSKHGKTCLELALNVENVSCDLILCLLNLGSDKSKILDKKTYRAQRREDIRKLLETHYIEDIKEPCEL